MNQRSQRDREFHDAIAHTYDPTVVEPRALANNRLFAKAYKHLPRHSLRMLDLGCGTGHMAVRFGGLASELTLVDHSAAMLTEAKRRVGQAHRHLPVSARQGDVNAVAMTLLEARAKFDLITTVGVLHHLSTDEIQRLVAKVKRLLAAGGRWIIAEPIETTSQEPRLLRWWNAAYRSTFVLPWAGITEPDEAPLPWAAIAAVLRGGGFAPLAERRGWEIFPRWGAADAAAVPILDLLAGSRGDGPVHMGVYGLTLYGIDKDAP